MNIHEAHHFLNKRKQGLAVAQYLVDHALVICGDIGPSCFNGKNSRVEGSSMAQGTGVGEMPNIPMAWDFERFNKHHESPQ